MFTDDSDPSIAQAAGDDLEPPSVPKTRRPRRDKGLVFATARDLACLAWIGEQYAARFDQAQRLLSRAPGAPTKTPGLIAWGTAKDQIDRWVRAGWVVYYRFLANEPGWMYLTRRGLELVGQDTVFRAKPPSATRLHHIWAVNQVRLFAESNKNLAGYEWVSERRLRAEEEQVEREARADKERYERGPIPDGHLFNDDWDIAVEVELTPKKPDVLKAKLERLVNDYEGSYTDWHPVYDYINFMVPDKKMLQAVERARAKFSEDDQKRIIVAIPDYPLV